MSTSNVRITANKNISSSFHGNVRRNTQEIQQSGTNINAYIRRLPNILTEQEINRLRAHKYASEGTTLLDPYMQIFWKRLVEYCPLWVAPNLLTIVGLIINVATNILLLILTNGGKEQCARWMYFLTALGLFFYQSLDAIDGKQARRTDSSTPLGELFDHGCDSVSTVLLALACCCVLQIGDYPWLMFWCCMIAFATFYCAHWQAYVSGKLKFATFDCTEAQFFFIFVCMTTIITSTFWAKTIPIINIEYRVFTILSIMGSGLCSMANNIYAISQGGCGRNFSSVAGTSLIFPAWPISFFTFLVYLTFKHSLSTAHVEHTSLHLICYGLIFSKIANRLIVANMSKSSLNAWDTAFIGPIAFRLNQHFNYFIGEHISLWFLFIFSLYDLLRYNTKVCQQLCDALNIHCFRIKPPIIIHPDRAH